MLPEVSASGDTFTFLHAEQQVPSAAHWLAAARTQQLHQPPKDPQRAESRPLTRLYEKQQTGHSGFSCLTAIVAWLIEFFTRLQTNVLTSEEVQNGWTSESRSQFGYSYYFVVLAFILSLVNIFIVSLVRFESWTSDQSLSSKRHSRAACEGVIMLY